VAHLSRAGRPPRPAGFRRPRLWQEVLLIGSGYVLYAIVRNQVPSRGQTPWDNAATIIDVERSLNLDVELAVNKAVAALGWLAQSANYYYATVHFGMTLGVLVWLYLRRPLQYRAIRTVLYATSIVALIGFYLYPLAPPRMLSEQGYIDTIVVFNTWGSYASGDVAAASNQFAAMPSLHFAWALWCGVALVVLSSRTWVKVAGVLYPVITFLVIVATANHFVLDAVGGLLALMCGFAVQRVWSGRSAFAGPADVRPQVGSPVPVASA
jgi:hypothetical protein